MTSGPEVAEEHCSEAGVVGDEPSAKIPAETKTAEGKIKCVYSLLKFSKIVSFFRLKCLILFDNLLVLC